MIFNFISFEVRYWLRSWMLWIFFLVIALMFFSAVSSDKITLGGALENTYRNAPWVIENFYSFACFFTLLMTVAFVNSAASRDFASNTYQLIFTTPVRRFDYLAGRFIGSALISVIPMLGVSFGIILAKYMPWVDPERWGSISWLAHLNAVLLFAIPNTFFIAAVIFAVAVLTRSTVASFIGGLVLLTAYAISGTLLSDIRNETLAALVDPFAVNTFALATKYWTVADKNHLTIGYTGLLLWNRLIWISVGLAIFAFAYFRFSFTERSSKKSKRAAKAEAIPANASTSAIGNPSFGIGAQIVQFWGSLKSEFRSLVKSTSFIVITAAALLNCLPNLILNASEGFGNTSLPVTYRMVELIEGTLYIFLISMITYYAGVLVWRERDDRMEDIHDALPSPEWPAYAAKFGALISALFLIQCLVITTGVLVQFFSGFHRYQIGLYISELLILDFSFFIFLIVLAFFIHVISPNKYIGYFGFIVFLIANAFVWRPLHVATHLVQFASRPRYIYSDFYGYRPYLDGLLWFTLYWAFFCGLLAIASILFWQRGRETGWNYRLQAARERFSGGLRPLTYVCAAAFVGIGSWIFYNTEVLNKIQSEHDRDLIAVDYEKDYKKYQGLPAPRVTDVKYTIDLVPETQNATMNGSQTIVNETTQPIRDLYLNFDTSFENKVQIPGAKLVKDDQRLGSRFYQFDPPLQPQENRQMTFTVKTNRRGFENDFTHPEVIVNGTFFNNTAAPQINYQPGREMDDKNDRKKYGLKEKDRMPALERNCTVHCADTYISNNSDWVNVETVISTSPDQIAIAPGSLIKEWSANGRRYFQYKLDHYSLNFYAFISAGYEVKREEWNGIKMEVYYLKEHPWNVPKMQRSIRKSFEYYTTNFGTYAHKEARIIEFPRVARFAQAFPGTMPYSEGIGFIAAIKKPDDIDSVYYVVAHEMAHQWWAHQLIGANMQGATLLSETLAQYSALMVMEKEYGRDAMRKFLEYEMDNYLRSRGREPLKERPLLTVESSQGYVHYRKGSVVMYYLREMIGEDAINRALRKVLQQYGYKQPPYPTSYMLVDALKEETPPQLQYLLKDLFYDITLFSNRALSATATKRKDGKYDVKIEVEAKKFKADDQGNEVEVPVDDWIEIGALAAPAKGKRYGKVLDRERVHMTKSGRATYEFTVNEEPDKAGIDPLFLLIDRIPDDNLKSVDIH